MTSIAGLERRIKRLVAQLEPESTTRCLVLETGEEVPPEVAARFGPRDYVIIQEVPPGYFDGLEPPEIGR